MLATNKNTNVALIAKIVARPSIISTRLNALITDKNQNNEIIILKVKLDVPQSSKRIQVMLSRVDNGFDVLRVNWAMIISATLFVPHQYLLGTHDRIMWSKAENINQISKVVGTRFKEYYSQLIEDYA